MSILGSDYVGKKAEKYDEKRETKAKWIKENKLVAQFLVAKPGTTVLDIPFGTGRFIPLYGERAYKVTGIDVSAEMLQLALHKMRKTERLIISLEIGNVMKLKYADREFDTTVCIRLLHLMNEKYMALALAELLRVTKRQLILTIQLGSAYSEGGDTATHCEHKFLARIHRAGWYVAAREKITGAGWHVMKLERKQ